MSFISATCGQHGKFLFWRPKNGINRLTDAPLTQENRSAQCTEARVARASGATADAARGCKVFLASKSFLLPNLLLFNGTD